MFLLCHFCIYIFFFFFEIWSWSSYYIWIYQILFSGSSLKKCQHLPGKDLCKGPVLCKQLLKFCALLKKEKKKWNIHIHAGFFSIPCLVVNKYIRSGLIFSNAYRHSSLPLLVRYVASGPAEIEEEPPLVTAGDDVSPLSALMTHHSRCSPSLPLFRISLSTATQTFTHARGWCCCLYWLSEGLMVSYACTDAASRTIQRVSRKS